MNLFRLFFCLVLVSCLLSQCFLQPAGAAIPLVRQRQLMDSGWRFQIATTGMAISPSSPAYNDKAWRIVHLPHDYVVEGKFDPKGDVSHAALPTPPAWYRRTFTLPASDQGQSVWIDFDGVYRDAKVYLNGVLLGEHPSGYTGFHYDISRAAHYGGVNVLAVSVNPTHHEGWWYEGGGIYRHVWLNVAAPMHIAPWSTFVTTKLPEPGPSGKPASAAVTVRTTIANQSSTPRKAALLIYFTQPDGLTAPVASTALTASHVVPAMGNITISKTFTVLNPRLWSLEKPQLYQVHIQIVTDPHHSKEADVADGQYQTHYSLENFRIIDSTDTPFGIRTIRYDAQKGFFLNGMPVKIKGTCNHQDFAGVGIGMPDSLLYWRIKKLKAMGSNAYRMSHNAPAPELLDACDRLGMLVMDENRHLGDTEEPKAPPTTSSSDLSDLKSLILRDRNHPSIIMWSLCNEEGIQYSTQGRDIFAAMKKVVNASDGTRPITCAMDNGYTSPDGISSVEDLQSINYHSRDYDTFHKAHPNQPLYGSETSSEVGTRGVYGPEKFTIEKIEYLGDQAQGHVSAYDLHAPIWAEKAEAAWQAIAARPFVAGGFVWTGFDYKGEPTPFAWPDINSNFGVMDECGFPKDTYYYYQSVWSGKPMVHLLPHWNWAGREGQPIDVWAYSSTDRVELLLNGRSLGIKEMAKGGHAAWSVPYSPGTLEARGLSNGQVIAVDKVESTGVPAALKLVTDRKTLTADGEDLALVEVDVVDAEGRVVPMANNMVRFSVTGAGHLAGVGNGDPSSHEPDQASERHAFSGRCLVLVGAGELPGKIRLTARSQGLQTDVLDLRCLLPLGQKK